MRGKNNIPLYALLALMVINICMIAVSALQSLLEAQIEFDFLRNSSLYKKIGTMDSCHSFIFFLLLMKVH